MKILIDDVVERMAGGAETELPPGTVIRFQGADNLRFTVRVWPDGEGIQISKVADTSEALNIIPVASNICIIK